MYQLQHKYFMDTHFVTNLKASIYKLKTWTRTFNF